MKPDIDSQFAGLWDPLIVIDPCGLLLLVPVKYDLDLSESNLPLGDLLLMSMRTNLKEICHRTNKEIVKP